MKDGQNETINYDFVFAFNTYRLHNRCGIGGNSCRTSQWLHTSVRSYGKSQQMNEKIKQLALDAGIGFTLWDDSGREMIDNYTPEEYLEKFAELIVRECLSQVDKIRDGLEADSEDQQALGADWAGLAIARHFGVEE